MPESLAHWTDWLAAARYVLAVFFVISLPPAVCWWFFVHPLARSLRRLGAKPAMALVLVLFVAGIVALYPLRRALLIEDLGFRPLLAAFGVPLVVVAGLIARQRKKYLGWRILMGLPELSDEPADSKLLDEGIYARIRHPRYLEIVFGLPGWGLVLNYVGVYVVAVATIASLHLIVLLEERELRERFGAAYEEYAARVPRYLPHRSR